jgi:hypothetical protein
MPVIRNERHLFPEHRALVLAQHLCVWSRGDHLLAAILQHLPVLMHTCILWQMQLQRCLTCSLAE